MTQTQTKTQTQPQTPANTSAAPSARFNDSAAVAGLAVPATDKQRDKVAAEIKKRTFLTLSTASPAGYSHAAGVIYEAVGGSLWIHTLRSSRKARNIAASGRVGVCIPFRKLPVGPPYTVQFQTTASLVEMDDPEILRLLDKGHLKNISGHGALEMADGCFIKLSWPQTVHSYGLGAKLIDLIRDPLNSGAGRVTFGPGEAYGN
ncbi:MAG: pyridoxamine 5'-phosphate oxidase family protein [Acidimicrobiales bacterium]